MSIFDLQNSEVAALTTSAPTLATPTTRNPYPQFNAFRSFIINELIRRKTTYPVISSTPFVRFTSCKADQTQNYRFFSLGLSGFGKEIASIFDLTYGSVQGDIVGYAYDTITNTKTLIKSNQLTADMAPPPITNNSAVRTDIIQKAKQSLQTSQQKLFAGGTNPNPGITNISISRAGLGVPVVATVKFLCYNRNQLEFLRNHFMIPGSYVVLEWGNQFPNKQLTNILDFTADNIIDVLVQTQLRGRGYVIDNWVAPNNANYDLMVGKVGNFTIGYDARSNVYEIMVRVVTSGENPWGLNSAQTNLRISSDDDPTYVSSIHTYFQSKGAFDIFLGQLAADDSKGIKVSKYNSAYLYTTNVNSLPDLKNLQNNPRDYLFLSWNSFINDIIPHLLRTITPQSAKQELQQFMKMNTPQIGSNSLLQSCDPDVILITKQMKNVPDSFNTIGHFDDDDPTGVTGNINKGVWINTGAIRESFVGTNSFMAGMSALLNRMNDAVAGYWALQMYYDEENGGKYTIIDNKGTTKTNFPRLYMFNYQNKGELVELNMESGFPPELITQMMLFSQFKNNKLQGQQLLDNLPFMASSSTFIFAMSWTNLVDLIDQEMTNQLNKGALPQDASGLADFSGNPPLPNQSSVSLPPVPITANVSVASDDTRVAISKLGTSAKPDAKLGVVPSNNTTTSTDTISPVINNSSTPITTPASAPSLTSPSNTLTATTPVTTAINFSAYANVVGSRESGNTYTEVETQGQINADGTTGPPTAALGRYQFIPKTLWRYGYLHNPPTYSTITKTGITGLQTVNNSANWTGKNGINSVQDFLNSESEQNLLFQKFTQDNYTQLFGTLPTMQQDSSKGEVAGTLMAAHLTGAGGTTALINNTSTANTSDGIGTTNSSYYALGYASQGGTIADGQKSLTAIQSQSPHGIAQAQVATAATTYKTKFGNPILTVVTPDRAGLINRIAKDGYTRYPIENSFVAPIPTMTSIELKLLGTAGFSVSDGFFVDKLPFIFQQYGCFQTIEVHENISIQGWYTTVKGFYRMLWIDGEGPPEPPFTGVTTNG